MEGGALEGGKIGGVGADGGELEEGVPTIRTWYTLYTQAGSE